MTDAEWERLVARWAEIDEAHRAYQDDYARTSRQTSRRLLCAAIAAAGVLAVLYAGFRS